LAPLRAPRAFEQQVVQHESEIESRVTYHALGVEDHGLSGPISRFLGLKSP
jgi:hypothetical protein